jgi:hypothetical protein
MMDRKENDSVAEAQVNSTHTDREDSMILRPWIKPVFERIPLNEALSGGLPGLPDADGATGYS